jgi:hypothetical protein
MPDQKCASELACTNDARNALRRRSGKIGRRRWLLRRFETRRDCSQAVIRGRTLICARNMAAVKSRAAGVGEGSRQGARPVFGETLHCNSSRRQATVPSFLALGRRTDEEIIVLSALFPWRNHDLRSSLDRRVGVEAGCEKVERLCFINFRFQGDRRGASGKKATNHTREVRHVRGDGA